MRQGRTLFNGLLHGEGYLFPSPAQTRTEQGCASRSHCQRSHRSSLSLSQHQLYRTRLGKGWPSPGRRPLNKVQPCLVGQPCGDECPLLPPRTEGSQVREFLFWGYPVSGKENTAGKAWSPEFNHRLISFHLLSSFSSPYSQFLVPPSPLSFSQFQLGTSFWKINWKGGYKERPVMFVQLKHGLGWSNSKQHVNSLYNSRRNCKPNLIHRDDLCCEMGMQLNFSVSFYQAVSFGIHSVSSSWFHLFFFFFFLMSLQQLQGNLEKQWKDFVLQLANGSSCVNKRSWEMISYPSHLGACNEENEE